MPALPAVTFSPVMLLFYCVNTPGLHNINLCPLIMWMEVKHSKQASRDKKKTESLTNASYLPIYAADHMSQFSGEKNKNLQSAFTWNLFPQNVLVESNENICITVGQLPQFLVYVTLAEEIICHICPVCGKQMIKWVHRARRESCCLPPINSHSPQLRNVETNDRCE